MCNITKKIFIIFVKLSYGKQNLECGIVVGKIKSAKSNLHSDEEWFETTLVCQQNITKSSQPKKQVSK